MEIWEKSKLERRKAMAHILEVPSDSIEMEEAILKIKKSKIQVAEANGGIGQLGSIRLDKQSKLLEAKIEALRAEQRELEKKRDQYIVVDPRWIYWDQKSMQVVRKTVPLAEELNKIWTKKLDRIKKAAENFDPFGRTSPRARKMRVASLLAREEVEAQFLQKAPPDLK